MKSLSIQAKIIVSLLIVAVVVVSGSVAVTYKNERQLAFDMMLQQTSMTAYFYLDNLNIMMVNDEMEDRDLLQNKMMEQPGIIEARILRSELLDSEWGEGFEDQYPRDDYERKALEGEEFTLLEDTEQGRRLTLIFPIPALEVYRGTECLGCHEEVTEEGQILGAIRVSYSLDDFDQKIFSNILNSGVLLTVMFAVGVLITLFVLNRVMTRPLRCLGETIADIESTSDLSRRVDVRSADEVGRVAAAYNSMLDKFQRSLLGVRAGVADVNRDSEQIARVSDETLQAVMQQHEGTTLVATAMNQMQATSNEVMNSANTTRVASDETGRLARDSVKVMEGAIVSINGLSQEIERIAQVILRVGTQSEKVGSVLDVINGVAEQTNLLALNAAIEAARAGEMGRGFAVVADEVRSLANKTHNSTREVQTVIEGLQKESKQAIAIVEPAKKTACDGIAQAQNAVEALQDIVRHVEQIKAMNDQVASASDEQNAVSEEINRNVVEISVISDATSARANDALKRSQQLVQRAEELATLIKSFRLE